MHGNLNVLFVLRADEIADDHTGPHGQSAEKADEQKDDGAGAGYGGQCVGAEKVPYNQRVRRVVKLLKQVPEQQRQGERGHFFPDHTFGHKSIILPQNFFSNF